jgi:cystathionine beta-lyase/cystathionine gamma-synthase
VTTGAVDGYACARLGNPTVDALADAVAEQYGRVSVGLERPAHLMADVVQALEAARTAR